uniref:CSON013023 protein n=1 Tax=Culicoides sonorensis TaxID=179676 RepID=A0A336NB43_CULSO
MNKIIIFACIASVLLFHIELASGLRCYDCKQPNQECLLNYQNKVTDCDSEFISGAISTLTGQKRVCAKYGNGKNFFLIFLFIFFF